MLQRLLRGGARHCGGQRALPVWRRCGALCGNSPVPQKQRCLGEDLRWGRPVGGLLDAAEEPTTLAAGEPRARAEAHAVQPARGSAGGHRYPAPPLPDCGPESERDVEALVALLQSDPAVCRRVACAVDVRTAEHWAAAREEFEAVVADATATEATGRELRPQVWQLWYLHVRTAVPFVGFGFFDNMIMLTVGGAIESTIGVAFGISTLAAAGMGQMVSDASGITLQGLIERFADKLGLPHPRLTPEQQRLAFIKSFVLASRILGIVFGCCLGLFPLLLMPEKRPFLVDQIAEALPAQRRREFISLVQTREFQTGDMILRRGEMSGLVFLIDKGQVECVGRDAEGLPFLICTMSPGNSFGKPQLHCPSHVDLIAKDGPVVVQCIAKDDFLRITGQEGLEVWENTHPPEHTVYFAVQGRRITDAIPPASRGTGKTRMFATLSDEDKCEVLRQTGLEEALQFKGVPNEGKVRFFAGLSEEQKHSSLAKWHEHKFGRSREVSAAAGV